MKWLWVKIKKLASSHRQKKPKSIHPEHIQWRGCTGQSLADCVYCGREITQEETDIEYVCNTWGDRRARGKIWCNKCGAVQYFDTVEWE